MGKLSLDALKMRAEAVTTEELMANIGGGTENACHDSYNCTAPTPSELIDQAGETIEGVYYFYEFWYRMIKYGTGNGW